MDKAHREAAQRRCDAASPAPWEWCGDQLDGSDYRTVLEVRDLPEHAYGENQTGELVMENEAPDKDFIANARQDLPAALAEIARLEAEVERLRGERDEARKTASNIYAVNQRLSKKYGKGNIDLADSEKPQ